MIWKYYSDMKIVKVFKTDVRDQQAARQIVLFLQKTFIHCRVNFDLDDCDNILRIESGQDLVSEEEIRSLVEKWGFYCEPLPG